VRKLRIHFFVLVGLLAVCISAGAQAPRGFSSQMLVTQLSLYLPEEATRGMDRGFGGSGNAPSAQSASSGQASGGGAPAAGRGFPQIQFTRNPKLFLTKEQITGLLPILIALRDNPLPTPGKAKQVQADVEGQLTAAQKAEWTEFQKKLQELIDEFRQRMGANASGGGQGSMSGQGSPTQGQDPGAQGSAPQTTLLQRRQRQLDAFIKVLQDRLKTGV
jgi:hypothetical protein